MADLTIKAIGLEYYIVHPDGSVKAGPFPTEVEAQAFLDALPAKWAK